MRFRDYFEVNGIKYYTGTIFIANNLGQHVEATFVGYDMQYSRYIYRINSNGRRIIAHDEYFWDHFINVTDRKDESAHTPILKTKKDSQIDGLFHGWLWYIFLMAISTIFKGAIVWWIFISIVFFSWRSNKIKKEGTYYDWW